MPATLAPLDSEKDTAKKQLPEALQTPEAKEQMAKFMKQAEAEASKILTDMDENQRRNALQTLRTTGDPLDIRDGETTTSPEVIYRWMRSAPGDLISKSLNGAIYQKLLAEFSNEVPSSTESSEDIADQLLHDMSSVSKNRILAVLKGERPEDNATVERWVQKNAGTTKPEQLKQALKDKLQ